MGGGGGWITFNRIIFDSIELYNGHWTRLPDCDKTVKTTKNVVGVNVDECPDHPLFLYITISKAN